MNQISENEKLPPAKSKSKTKWVVTLVVILVIGIAVAAKEAAVQDRVVRSRMSEAVSEGGVAKLAVTLYFQEKNVFPKNLPEAGYKQQPTRSVRQFVFDQKNGVISVILAFEPHEGQTIKLAPTVSADKTITWHCSSVDVPAGILPPQCR
jgi:hypothetical protein